MIIERDLIRALNSGTAIALVGAGASIDVGLPNWSQLAWEATSLLSKEKFGELRSKIEALINSGKQPEVFSIICQDVGIDKIADWLQNELKAFRHEGNIYPIVANWPFANYLTTNYDNALVYFLKKGGVPAVERFNSPEDFKELHADTKNVVFKIHGDPRKPDDLILTSEQFDKFTKDEKRRYWVAKITSLLHMHRVVIIGYSLSDPYFRELLETAKQFSSPARPIYIFATGFEEEQIVDLYLKNGIVVIPYQNDDGSHKDLLRTLHRHGIFVAPRNSEHIGVGEINAEEMEIASSIYIFSKLRGDAEFGALAKAYGVTILKVLSEGPAKGINQGGLVRELEKRLNLNPADSESVYAALEMLQQKGFISYGQDQQFSISESGKSEITSSVGERKRIEEQFNIACSIFLDEQYPGIDEASQNEIISEMAAGLTLAFEKRGLEIARRVYADQALDASNAIDLLEAINVGSTKFENREFATAYLDLMIEIITRPNQEMRNYLALLAQGYFAFHTLGWHKKAADERLKIAQQSKWVLDASVIIPALAKYSMNHEYALDLLERAKELGLRFATTKLLFEEVLEHANWATTNFSSKNSESENLILAATGRSIYRPNLFLSGFMSWSNSKGNRSLEDYFSECFGEAYKADLEGSITSSLTSLGIEVVDFDKAAGIQAEHLALRDGELVPKIIQKRQELGTYRSEHQCQAEAEVLILAQKFGFRFLSQSTVLDKITKSRISLSPEDLYRFISLQSSTPPEPNLIYSSMAALFYSAGIVIVDVESVRRFIKPAFQQARLQLDREKAEYEKLLGKRLYQEHINAIDNAPEEDRSFYSLRTLMLIADRATELGKRAEQRAKEKPIEAPLSKSDKQELDRLRAKKREREIARQRKRRARISNPKKRRNKRKD